MAFSDLESHFASLAISEPKKDVTLETPKPKSCHSSETKVKKEQELSEQTYSQLLQKDHINSFNPSFQLLFRTTHLGSPIQIPNGDLFARMNPPPIPEALSQPRITTYVSAHAKKDLIFPGPFISTTTDLLRALNIANNYRVNRKRVIKILVIDASKLECGSYMPCNELRESLGLERPVMNDYKTEVLVWGKIPARAIVGEWGWERVQGSKLPELFPSLEQSRQYRSLSALRKDLCLRETPGVWVSHLVDILLDELGLRLGPATMAPKQLALIMLGWAHAKIDVDWFPLLQKYMEMDTPDDVRALDQMLYEKDLEDRIRGEEKILRAYEECGEAPRNSLLSSIDALKQENDEMWGDGDGGWLGFQAWWEKRENAASERMLRQSRIDQSSHGLRRYLRELSTEEE